MQTYASTQYVMKKFKFQISSIASSPNVISGSWSFNPVLTANMENNTDANATDLCIHIQTVLFRFGVVVAPPPTSKNFGGRKYPRTGCTNQQNAVTDPAIPCLDRMIPLSLPNVSIRYRFANINPVTTNNIIKVTVYLCTRYQCLPKMFSLNRPAYNKMGGKTIQENNIIPPCATMILTDLLFPCDP